MIDRLTRYREPATWLALAMLGVSFVASVVTMGRHLAAGMPVTAVAKGTSGVFTLMEALVLTALVLTCVAITPITRHGRMLAGVSSVVIAAGAVIGLALLVLSLPTSGWLGALLETAGGLTDLVLKGLFAYGLWLAFRSDASAPSRGRVAATASGTMIEPGKSAPTWDPAQASGAVWRRAEDAATGELAAATGKAPSGPRIIVSTVDAAPPPRTGPPSWDPAADQTRRPQREA